MKIKIRGWLYDTVTGEWVKGKLKSLPKPVPEGMYILDYLDMVNRAVDKVNEGEKAKWAELYGLKRS